MALYIDLHVLQSVPFSNLNRDDLGSPKTVRYGSTDRVRVSSQSWKREIRHEVEERLGEYARRTRLVPAKVAETLVASDHGWPEDLAKFAGEQVARSAGKDGLKTEEGGKTSVLLYLPQRGIEELAVLCAEHRPELEAALGTKAKAAKAKDAALLPRDRVNNILKSRTATIDLFGRMLAELPGGKVDGAVQVAHAFTTHGSDPQRDFFTAVDDWLPAVETGSGHMQTGEFATGNFYRFATVNLTDLLKNLGQDRTRARELVELFIDAYLMSIPQAKKNSTAAHTLPDLAYFAVRDRRPVSFAAAFEQPVRASAGGFAEPARRDLDTYAAAVQRLTGGRGRLAHGHACIDDKPLENLGTRHSSFADFTDAALDTAFTQPDPE
ncbi:type I-E CRISPR-associated protein Cas7/Cse4/CasC [Streptacidiphilus cavernicola]|uniref:Type I-E CRISPR-associated protein Cas7/Cse4/CasC n=1 Tax=Streptacidiphilus cavernicola TaxID=3342716 RepID=A0ABV6VVG1_9ACTN